MASLWISTYTKLRDGMLKERGTGGPGAGAKPGDPWTLPSTRPLDCYAILAELHPELLRVFGKWSDEIWMMRVSGPTAPKIIDPFDKVSPSEYLAGIPAKGDAIVRMIPKSATGNSLVGMMTDRWYSFAFDAGWGATDETASVRYILEKWDRCIQLAGGAFLMMPLHPTLTPSATTEWWRALYALMVAIEVVIQLPTPGLWDRMKSGIKYASTETIKELGAATKELAHAAGQAAGEIATVAGEATGKALAGFWQTSGFAGYIFVGGAIYLVINGWV